MAYYEFYTNRKNEEVMKLNYELLEKITPYMLNNQESYCLHHRHNNTDYDITIVTNIRYDIIRIGYFDMAGYSPAYINNEFRPDFDFHILIDETKKLARVKTVYGDEYQYLDKPISRVPTIENIDDQDEVAVYFMRTYETLEYNELDDEYVCEYRPDMKFRAIDVNDTLTKYLKRILKKMAEQGGEFFHKYVRQEAVNENMIEPISYIGNYKILYIHMKTMEINYDECNCDDELECVCEGRSVDVYLCECVGCGKLFLITKQDIELSNMCDHNNWFRYYYDDGHFFSEQQLHFPKEF